jgi:hypothetical protein
MADRWSVYGAVRSIMSRRENRTGSWFASLVVRCSGRELVPPHAYELP